jgi:hypothetical protein
MIHSHEKSRHLQEMRGFGQAHEAELELLREDWGPLGTPKVCAKRVRSFWRESLVWGMTKPTL